MNEEYAWKQICAQIKKNDKVAIMIMSSFFALLAGVIILVFAWKIGIVIILAGSVLLIMTAKKFSRPTADTELLYEKFFLTKWLDEFMEDVEFSTEYNFTGDELKEKEYFHEEWKEVSCARAFVGTYKGVKIRAAEVSILAAPNVINKKKYYLEEPEYIFQGRIWEIDSEDFICPMEDVKVLHENGKTVIFHNLYKDIGAYEWWMPSPTKENLNLDALRENVIKTVKCYLE